MQEKSCFWCRNFQSIIICIIIGVSFFSIALEFGKRLIPSEKGVDETQVVSELDWSKEFPFPEQMESTDESIAAEEKNDIVQKYLDKVTALKTALTNTKYYVWNYYHFIETAGFIDKITGINLFDGNSKVVKLGNGRVDWYEGTPLSDEDASEAADVLSEFSEFVTESGKDFVYVETPKGICKYNPQLPVGITDYANDNKDKFIRELNQKNIPVLDLRDALHKDNLTHEEIFYKTDHHWNAEGGFWAATKVVDYLNSLPDKKYTIGNEYLKLDEYEEETLPNLFLGAEGRKVTRGYISPETFSLLIPEFDTSLSVSHPGENVKKEGKFRDVIYDWDVLNDSSLYETSYYEAQLDGNQPLTIIHNNNLENGKSALLICDSFSLGMAPYLAMELEDVYLIDYRNVVGFNGSYRTFIEKYNPDIVMLTARPGVEELYKFTDTGSK